MLTKNEIFCSDLAIIIIGLHLFVFELIPKRISIEKECSIYTETESNLNI